MTTGDRAAVSCALGRIFAMLMRPSMPGDREEYESCRAVVLGSIDPALATTPYRPDWARDRLRGAAGD